MDGNPSACEYRGEAAPNYVGYRPLVSIRWHLVPAAGRCLDGKSVGKVPKKIGRSPKQQHRAGSVDGRTKPSQRPLFAFV